MRGGQGREGKGRGVAHQARQMRYSPILDAANSGGIQLPAMNNNKHISFFYLMFCFPGVCPEPVLANARFSSEVSACITGKEMNISSFAPASACRHSADGRCSSRNRNHSQQRNCGIILYV